MERKAVHGREGGREGRVLLKDGDEGGVVRGGVLEADQREVSLGYCCAQRNSPAFSTLPEERGVGNKRSCLLNGPRAALDCQHFLLTTSLSCRAASTPTALPQSRRRCSANTRFNRTLLLPQKQKHGMQKRLKWMWLRLKGTSKRFVSCLVVPCRLRGGLEINPAVHYTSWKKGITADIMQIQRMFSLDIVYL